MAWRKTGTRPSSATTILSGVASTPEAKELLWQAINDALENWRDLDDALFALDELRKIVQKTAEQR